MVKMLVFVPIIFWVGLVSYKTIKNYFEEDPRVT